MVATGRFCTEFRRFCEFRQFIVISLVFLTLMAVHTSAQHIETTDEALNTDDHLKPEEQYAPGSDDMRMQSLADIHEISQDFYSFNVEDIAGKPVSLMKYRGKVSLVVNVASECGYTDGHYKELVRLQERLGETNHFTVLAFPCNQFGAQEPKSNVEIESFGKTKYKVNFPMFSKINVLDDNVPQAWQYLKEKSGKNPNWNFWKYLVNAEGRVIDAWGPWIPVTDVYPHIKAAVKQIPVESEHTEL